MSVPPLRLGSSFESYISGEVIIHKSAVIAPGVILQAAPNSKIIIGAGVCIGMGSIIQVDRGTLEIETGASLGAGFLMVGEGKIGSNACIGAATTVFRTSVASTQVIQPGSILGYCDASRMPLRDRHNRHVEAIIENQIPANNSTAGTIEAGQEVSDIGDINGDLWGLADSPPAQPQTQSQTNNGSTGVRSQFKSQFKSQSPASNNIPVKNQNQPVEDSTKVQTTTESTKAAESSLASNDTLNNHVYGQSSVQRLLVTLFPHRQPLNKPLPEDD
ncbi:transferase [Brunnivagina elsteri]|uniref:Transferase n=1 Tax=Brunnivagina elsteri CCALA 953 TaxID=987040 RepID=A0A2A2THA9_9CYAN|nr:transferase [Calothrix elsteri]PAX53130.1 transferase [Calothrix elsteri CCALA 953]